MRIVITILMSLLIITLCSCGSKPKKETAILDFSSEKYGAVDTGDLKLAHGDLLGVNQNGRTVVIKAKIKSSATKEMTINQNYFSVDELIRNHGFNTCDELQYWAVADMQDGSESKVIQFTLTKDVIDKIYAGSILSNQVGDHVTDLWILPSLQN